MLVFQAKNHMPRNPLYIAQPYPQDVDAISHYLGAVIAPALSKKVSEKGIEFKEYAKINDRNVVKKLTSFGLDKDNVLEGVQEAISESIQR
jgi:hypothetical protein